MQDGAWVPKRVSALRFKLNMTQVQFARKLHVSRQAISLWELGARIPSRLNQYRLEKLAAGGSPL